MKNLTYLYFGVIMMLLIQACTDKHGKNYNTAGSLDTAAVTFINNGLEGGLAEIKASGLVITKSSNQRVISFAKMMLVDHTKADEGLKKLAGDKQVAVKDTIYAPHLKIITDLSRKSGREFDKAYLQMMVTDHLQAVNLFTKATQNNDIAIKNFATTTLPTLQMHLDSANAILTAIK
jgi:putative membrane protein